MLAKVMVSARSEPGNLSRRYRTQLCKDGVQCNRPVCFFAHTMQQLRLGSLPASLRSADGAQFAAYYGGPAYGRMRSAGQGHASAGEVKPPSPCPVPQPCSDCAPETQFICDSYGLPGRGVPLPER